MRTNVVVDVAVTAEPAFQLAMRVGAADFVDALDISRIDRELDAQPVRAGDVERDAITVIGDAVLDAMRLHPRNELIEALLRGLQGDMPPAAARRQDRLRLLIDVVIGELEKGEGAA